MRIERIEIRFTDLKTRLQRLRSTGPYDTGASGDLLGKPVLVRVFAEGVVGDGQIRPLAPHHSLPDTHGSIITVLRDICGPRLIGRSIFDLAGIHAVLDKIAPFNTVARAALDHALHDAIGKALGQPVYNLIGGLAQPRLPLEWSISMSNDVGRMVADAERAVAEFGIKVLCMKSGHPKGWREDVANFIAIRKAVGPEISFGMDPNMGWTYPDTISAVRALQEHRLDYLEQPLDRRDIRGMAALRRAALGVPLMADEACASIQDAHALVTAEACDVMCIKLYKHGGIWPARKIAAIAEAANIKINCGGLAVHSQLEASAAAHFYASLSAENTMPAGEFIFGLGVIGPDPLVGDTDFVIRDGHVAPPSGPGFGITIDEKALEAHTLSKEVVT